MKKGRSISIIVVLFAVFFISTLSANAALELRGTDNQGNRLIYDTDYNITWYDYTKWESSWINQMNWASGLTVNFGGTIYDDWRLPTALNQDGSDPCYDYYCTGSEMGHLYYTELGNNADPSSSTSLNTGVFQHLEAGYFWSSTEYSANTANVWVFGTLSGDQGIIPKRYGWIYEAYAIAVRPGDVSSVVVPEPVSMILFGVGGTLLAGRRYLRRKA